MKLIKKYLVLAVVAVLFAGAFVLNIMANGDADKEEYDVNAENMQATAETEVTADYFETFRQDREEVRKLEMEYLDEVIAASASDQETLGDAQKQKLALVDNMEKEFTIESMIKAKGFEDAAVTFHSGTVNVVVKSNELNEGQVAQILDIVKRETGEPAGNIKVMAGQ